MTFLEVDLHIVLQLIVFLMIQHNAQRYVY